MSNAASDNCSSRGQNFYQFVTVSPVCYLGREPFLGEMRAFTLEIYTPGEIVESRRSLTARIYRHFELFKTHGLDRSMRRTCVSLTNTFSADA